MKYQSVVGIARHVIRHCHRLAAKLDIAICAVACDQFAHF